LSAGELRHPALEPSAGRPLGAAGLSDRLRLSLVLQGGALLAHLRLAGRRLEGGWQRGAVDEEGRLRSLRDRPGRPHRWCQQELLDLVSLLFGASDGEVAGRGQARRVLRELVGRWQQWLVPLAPDEAVGQLLEAATFLAEPAFAHSRRALAAEHIRGSRRWLWVAGPARLRSTLLSGVSSRDELLDRLTRFERMGPARVVERVGRDHLRTLVAEGRFAEAEKQAASSTATSARVVRLACQIRLGRLQAARRSLARLDHRSLDEDELVELAEAAVRLYAGLGDAARGVVWVERALTVARGRDRWRARLIAAGSAWDRGEHAAAERWLNESRAALGDPQLGWRWRQLAALAALGRGEPAEAERQLVGALHSHRRQLSDLDAATLWNDLAVARADAGLLAKAERAMLHSVRLHARVDGPRRTTLALCNLAEIRLRRGVLRGVGEALERSLAENVASGNRRALAYDHELCCRYALLRRGPEVALARIEQALARLRGAEADTRRPRLLALAARAHGWLGNEAEARESLAGVVDASNLPLEGEEIPALWALAGDRDRALREVREGPAERLWRAALGPYDLMPGDWDDLDALEPFRAARLVADLERVLPGCAPRERVRQALAALAHLDAAWLRRPLEHALEGAWCALEGYLAGPAGGARELTALFRQSGHPRARVSWLRAGREQEIIRGAGGEAAHSLSLAGGTLRVESDHIDGVARALLELVARDWQPPPVSTKSRRGGIVGRSPALLAALERARRLAVRDVPLLITGETGTGKELVARLVHRLSSRGHAPLVPLNSAALSETLVLSDLFGHVRGAFTGADRDRAGIFEAARGGTVLLDEIGDLPLQAQAMLLRVLQEGEVRRLGESGTRRVDVRVVAATHRRLDRRVERGEFRADLFYRLAVGIIELPPLRERGADLELLVEHFLERVGDGRKRLTAAAMSRLREHPWPGNVRELGNCVAVAVALAEGDLVRSRHLGLPERRTAADGGYHQRVLEFRRRLVTEALVAAGGNRAAAARRLGVSRQALSYLVRSLGLG
jgi:DNA-binding NtrC family response regulator